MRKKLVQDILYLPVLVARILGFFPITNLKYRQDPEQPEFRFWSYAVLYTLIVNTFLYLFGIEAIIKYVNLRESDKALLTDRFAKQFFLMAFFSTRFSSHIITILISPKILNCLKRIARYQILPSSIMLMVIFEMLHAIAEMSLLFVQCSTSFVAAAIQDRLNSIGNEFGAQFRTEDSENEEKQAVPVRAETANKKQIPKNFEVFPERFQNVNTFRKEETPDNLSLADEQSTGLNEGKEETIKTLTKKILQLSELCESLNDMSETNIFVLTAGTTTMLVALTYLMSINLTIGSGANTGINRIVGGFTTFLTFMRLLNLANIGQSLENSMENLKSTTIRVYSDQLESNLQRRVKYFRYLVSKTNFRLNALGFFYINRTFLIKILSPVVTFVVVLAQFRESDLHQDSQFIKLNQTDSL
ncbi:unnamed protein product [Allacma fusca]|uniref:Gustatory receptor n=1 Tax=Allacma fusca TaxID=39272 RepID=A0A8J2JP13_9HEXA|nr:unnamed protein product [Allacma fusca]